MAQHRAENTIRATPRYRRGQQGRRAKDPSPLVPPGAVSAAFAVGSVIVAGAFAAGQMTAGAATGGLALKSSGDDIETVSQKDRCLVVRTPGSAVPTPSSSASPQRPRIRYQRLLHHQSGYEWPSAITPPAAGTASAPTTSATSDSFSTAPSFAAPTSSAATPSTAPTASSTSVAASPAQTALGGLRSILEQPFASSSPWNTPLGAGAVYSTDGSALTQSLLQHSDSSYINSTAYSVPITVATDSDPVQSVSVSGPAGAAHHMPADAQIAQGTDGTMVVIDGTKAYEYWQARRDGSGHFSATYGTVVDLTGAGTSGGVRASGFSATAGLIRSDEMASIDHALVVSLAADQLRSGPVWPATLQDGDASSSYRGAVPMGSLLAIPKTVDLDSLGLSPEGLVLARALQDYGAYVGDRSSQMTLYAEPSANTTALDAMRADLRSKLAPLLRVVTNSSSTTVGGPGSRLAALPAALVGG
ncbi:hypothetical protein [Amnibacterium kyonggiense]